MPNGNRGSFVAVVLWMTAHLGNGGCGEFRIAAGLLPIRKQWEHRMPNGNRGSFVAVLLLMN